MAKNGFSLTDINRVYAQIICRMSGGTRLKIYRKLISLLHNRFSLMDALDRIRGIITNDGKIPTNLWLWLSFIGQDPCKTVIRSPSLWKVGRRLANA